MNSLLKTGSGMISAYADRGRPGGDEKRFLINYWLMCVVLMALVSGCGRHAQRAQAFNVPRLGPHQAWISGCSMFNENTRLLEPHLGWISGAVQIEYAGPEKFISYGYEIWKNGEVVKPISWGGSSMPVPFSGKLTVSMAEVGEYTADPKIRLILALVSETKNESGFCSNTSFIPNNRPKEAFSCPKQLAKPLVVSEGKEVAIWAYMCGKESGNERVFESYDDMAKRMEWALVIKVRIGKDQKNP
jgi:hypothetical protein